MGVVASRLGVRAYEQGGLLCGWSEVGLRFEGTLGQRGVLGAGGALKGVGFGVCGTVGPQWDCGALLFCLHLGPYFAMLYITQRMRCYLCHRSLC